MLKRNLALGALILLLGFLSVYPLSMLFYGSLFSSPPGTPGEFNLDGYRDLGSPENLIVLWNTLSIAVVKTGISVVLAIALAWIIARTDTPAPRTLEILITLPFFIPPILTAMAWGMLGNPQVGSLNLVWRWLSGTDGSPINVYSYGGVIWHMMQYSVPFIFLFIVDSFRAMDPALEEASRMSGASRTRTFFTITLVLMLPAITGAGILSFIRGIENFESPLFFGLPAGIDVLTTEIYNAITQSATPNYQYATALAFAAMVFMFLIILAQWGILRGRSFNTVTGKGYSPAVMKLGPWRWVTFSLCILFFVISVALPLGQLLLGSFFKFFGFYELDMLTLDNYRQVLGDDLVWRAVWNTLFLGLSGASLTMLLGGIVAYITVRTRWRGRRLIEALAWLPWLMPGIVLGLGFIWAFALMPGPIQIFATIWALLIAYISLGTPLAVRIMSSSYAQLSYDLEECSRVHGGSWWQTFWRIVIALSWPTFAVGWILVLCGIMRELSASVLLYSIGSEVLSVVVLKLWSNGKAEQVSVIGLLMMVLIIILRVAQLYFIQRRLNALSAP